MLFVTKPVFRSCLILPVMSIFTAYTPECSNTQHPWMLELGHQVSRGMGTISDSSTICLCSHRLVFVVFSILASPVWLRFIPSSSSSQTQLAVQKFSINSMIEIHTCICCEIRANAATGWLHTDALGGWSCGSTPSLVEPSFHSLFHLFIYFFILCIFILFYFVFLYFIHSFAYLYFIHSFIH